MNVMVLRTISYRSLWWWFYEQIWISLFCKEIHTHSTFSTQFFKCRQRIEMKSTRIVNVLHKTSWCTIHATMAYLYVRTPNVCVFLCHLTNLSINHWSLAFTVVQPMIWAPCNPPFESTSTLAERRFTCIFVTIALNSCSPPPPLSHHYFYYYCCDKSKRIKCIFHTNTAFLWICFLHSARHSITHASWTKKKKEKIAIKCEMNYLTFDH